MKHRWRLALFLSVIVTAFVIALFTPFTAGGGGRECGPDMGQLYRFVRDDIRLWRGGTVSLDGACRQHDHCYAHPNAPRADCDRNLLDNIQVLCASGETWLDQAYCGLMARSYYLSVRWFGWMAYDWDDARRERP
jgi:hypothetical protein